MRFKFEHESATTRLTLIPETEADRGILAALMDGRNQTPGVLEVDEDGDGVSVRRREE